MGLDQSFFISEKNYSMEDIMKSHIDGSDVNMEIIDVVWLRKVPALQEYMENLASERYDQVAERYGIQSYNSVEIPVSVEDLNKLKTLCLIKALDESATGFFWGTHEDGHYAEIIQAIDKVLAEVDEDTYIYYYGNY